METRKVQYEAVIHKADVPLAQGESLKDFMGALRASGETELTRKFNLDLKKSNVFMVEAFASAAIFEVYKYEGAQANDRMRFYAMKYTRKNDGNFEFSETKEVERVTTFREKTSVTKSKDRPVVIGDWQETSKSFWEGAL